MSDSPESKPTAWQPLTPRGVAAFAGASPGRLLLVQFVFALLAAAALIWFLRTAWFPTVYQAIQQLPAREGKIQAGKLYWPEDSPRSLAEGRFLAFVVDPNHTGGFQSPAQIQIEFGRDDICFRSLAGYRSWPYSPDLNFGFNRAELQPWWGAWSPPIQWLAFGAMLVWCMAAWALMATLYTIPVWLGGFFSNRDLSLAGTWKLAGAALMPGASLMIAAIILYGFQVLDLVQLAVVTGVHFVVGWVYVVSAVWVSPKLSPSSGAEKNPFAGKAVCEK